MRASSIIPIAVALIVLVASDTEAKSWRGIVPLQSTRTDVERLLGRSKNDIYKVEDQVVYIEYSRFPCDHHNRPGWPETPPGWDVPPDRVVSIVVSLGNKTVPLSSLGFDLSTFKKVRGDGDRPQHFYYLDPEDGFSIECFDFADNQGLKVTGFLYSPTSEEEKQFRCKR